MPHTPEPWNLRNPDGNHFVIFHRTEQPERWPEHEGSVICTSVIGDLPADQNRANGYLIVRAPRLANVLARMVAVEHEPPSVRAGVLNEARSLLEWLKSAGVL